MNLSKIFKIKAPADQKNIFGRVIVHKGDNVTKGVRCPRCGMFYEKATRIIACNNCGWKAPTHLMPKPWQIKRHDRRMRQQQKIIKKVKPNDSTQ